MAGLPGYPKLIPDVIVYKVQNTVQLITWEVEADGRLKTEFSKYGGKCLNTQISLRAITRLVIDLVDLL